MPRPSSGAGLSIAQLENILNDRRRDLSKLEKQRREVQRKLDEVDRQIERLGGSGGFRRNGGMRAHNPKSLPDTLEDVLRSAGKSMSVSDIVDAVRNTGYRSNAANFRAIVNQTLIKERKRFSPAGERGTYQLRKP